jgi:hypothetical protein
VRPGRGNRSRTTRPADTNLRLDRKRDDCGTDPKCCTIPESSFQDLQHIKNCAVCKLIHDSCVWGCPHHLYIGHMDMGHAIQYTVVYRSLVPAPRGEGDAIIAKLCSMPGVKYKTPAHLATPQHCPRQTSSHIAHALPIVELRCTFRASATRHSHAKVLSVRAEPHQTPVELWKRVGHRPQTHNAPHRDMAGHHASVDPSSHLYMPA